MNDLKKQKEKNVKKNMETAERVVGDIQSQWDIENAERLQERIILSQKRVKEYGERIDSLQKELRITQQNYVMEQHKLKDLRASENFKPELSQFNEEDAVDFGADGDIINKQSEILDKLEKGE